MKRYQLHTNSVIMKKHKFSKGYINLSKLNIEIPKSLKERLRQKKLDYLETVRAVMSSFVDTYKESYDESNQEQVNQNKDVLYLVELYNKDSEELIKEIQQICKITVKHKPLKVTLTGNNISISDILESEHKATEAIFTDTLDWYRLWYQKKLYELDIESIQRIQHISNKILCKHYEKFRRLAAIGFLTKSSVDDAIFSLEENIELSEKELKIIYEITIKKLARIRKLASSLENLFK